MGQIKKLVRIGWKFQFKKEGIMFCQKFSCTDAQPQERGSIVVLVALALTVLLGFCAIVTDVGLLYAKKAQLQNSVNAAALAGVQELPNKLDRAKVKAIDYASQNGIEVDDTDVTTSDSSITVQATEQSPTYFAQIWEITEQQISVSAKAMLVPLTGINGVVPLSIPVNTELNHGSPYELKLGAGDGDSGWYGALDLPGEKSFSWYLEFGYPETLSVGQFIDLSKGVESGPTRKAIENRLSQDSTNTFDDHDRNAPELMYIPIVKRPLASNQVQIVGFAAFYIDGIQGNGNESIITGRFLHQLASNGYNDASFSDPILTEYYMEHGVINTDFGVYTTKLVKVT